MCGIFGVLEHASQAPPDENRLLDAARLLGHRGPDKTALWRETGVGLVHTRLSLVDLSDRSHQPFWDNSRRFALVYNGEVYNFREIRQE